jgi:hypothetical protein
MAGTVADRAASVPAGVGPAGLPSMAHSIAMIAPTLVFQTMSPFSVPSGTSTACAAASAGTTALRRS